MNLYKLHSEPESLKYHDIAQLHIPELFWDKYKNNPKELKQREDAIAKDAEYSFYYALNVLRGPFQKGEDAIAKDAHHAYLYAQYILRKPFPNGEDAIAKDAWFSYLYVKNVLKAPFPKGEATIMKSEYADKYRKLL